MALIGPDVVGSAGGDWPFPGKSPEDTTTPYGPIACVFSE
jgi:hypothetical protein